MSIHIERPPIVYKSKYSIICELVGRPKPSSQAEEDYCQLVDRQNDTSVYVQIEMLTAYLNKLKNRADKISGKPRQSRSLSFKMLGWTFKILK